MRSKWKPNLTAAMLCVKDPTNITGDLHSMSGEKLQEVKDVLGDILLEIDLEQEMRSEELRNRIKLVRVSEEPKDSNVIDLFPEAGN